jgi:hypothetical protein
VTFDFNTLSAGDNNLKVQQYMQGVLDATFGIGKTTVTVTGAIADKGSGPGVVTANNPGYNGDGHTVGPGTGATGVTLGNSNGCTAAAAPCTPGTADAYIHNVSGINDEIKMVFTGVSFINAAFDGQIFPDGQCTKADGSGGHCGGVGDPNMPDFDFVANGTNVFTKFGVTPGTGGTYTNSTVGSAVSGSNPETAPQLLFTAPAGGWSFASSQTLEFIDWPSTVGIDNLVLTSTNTPSAVPEPGSIILLGTVASGFFLLARKMRKA